ncbi:MAG: hypothetical protein FJ297_11135 [Planctomycetes bacterium]|nr:hypothetical protein [Planctomycetota bacterium]
MKLWVSGKEWASAWFVETMVLEPFRGTSIGPAVIMKAVESLPFNLSLGQTPQMRELQYRLGWRCVTPLKTMVMPLNPLRLAFAKSKYRMVAVGLAGVMRAASVLRRLSSVGCPQLESSDVVRFDVRHDELWQSVQSGYACAVVRDASYLNWKYVDQPGQEFIRLDLRCGGRLRALAVMSISDPDSVYSYRRAFIVDLVVPLGDRAILVGVFKAIARECRVRDVDAIVLQVSHPAVERAAPVCGYLRRPPTRHLLVRPQHPDPGVAANVMNGDGWFLTMGDSDIDRPW